MKSAIDTLNHNIVAGEITFSLISSSYTEPPLSINPIDYFFIQNIVKIQPAPGISPVITINATEAEPYGLAIDGASKLIIDGANSDQNNRNTLLKVSGSNGKIALLIRGTEEATADSNTVKIYRFRRAPIHFHLPMDFMGFCYTEIARFSKMPATLFTTVRLLNMEP